MHYDIAVVGGGIAGISVAARLASRASVVVVEAEAQLGYHATGRSAAIYTECYGPGVIPRLTKASKEFLVNVPGPVATQRGLLFVAGAGQHETISALHSRFSLTVDDVALVDRTDVAELCSALDMESIDHGLYEPGAMDLDVHALSMEYRRMAMQDGANIRLEFRVDRIEGGSPWLLGSPTGEVTAGIIVNASGAWADVVAALADVPPLGVMPLNRSAFLFDPQIDMRSSPMVVDADERWYFKPDGPNVLGSAASEIPSRPLDARAAEEDVALGIERINDSTTFGIRSVKSTWAGLRTFTPDRVPAVGFAQDNDRFFWLVGQGGYGIKTSPALSEYAAGLILDGAVPDRLEGFGIEEEALTPRRFG